MLFLLLIFTFFLRKFYAKEQEYLEVNQRAGPKLCIPGIGAKRFLVVTPDHRVHRVVTAAFWRTFHHEGKISLAGKGGGCTPTSFHYYYHH
jgi:hypothetical protein